jgi:hypothetical protein
MAGTCAATYTALNTMSSSMSAYWMQLSGVTYLILEAYGTELECT